MKILFLFILIFSAVFGVRPAQAVPLSSTVPEDEPIAFSYLTEDFAQGRIIEDIEIDGLNRTADFVVLRELEFEQGDEFSKQNYLHSLQQIHNLWIFRTVDGELVKSGRKVNIRIIVEEKWTSIPYFLLGAAGGTSYFEVGFFDVNLMGRYLELGVAYERRGPANSYKSWYRNRRFLNRSLSFKAQIQDKAAVLPIYDDSDILKNEFSTAQKRIEISLDKEFVSWAALGVGIEVLTNNFNTTLISGEGGVANLNSPPGLPSPSRAYISRLRARFGDLNWDDYLLDGTTLEVSFDVAKPVLNSNSKFYRVTSNLLSYRQLPGQVNLAFRLGHGYTTADEVEHRYFLGGLQQVRGFRDNQFNGTNYLFGNAEVRAPSFQRPYTVLQHVAFFDFAKVGENTRTLSIFPYHASAGIGVRLVVPPIFLLAVRVDYAWTFGPIKRQGLSLGMVQYY